LCGRLDQCRRDGLWRVEASIGFRLCRSVARAERTIESYPVHRHRFPTSPRRTASASTGRPSCIRSYSETTNPGVQNPHCAPWPSTIDCWIGFSDCPSFSPSTVTTCAPSSWNTSWMQLVTAA
jgi:hypothetical protein